MHAPLPAPHSIPPFAHIHLPPHILLIQTRPEACLLLWSTIPRHHPPPPFLALAAPTAALSFPSLVPVPAQRGAGLLILCNYSIQAQQSV